MDKILEQLKNFALGNGVDLAKGIIFILLGYVGIRVLISILKRSVNRSKMEKTIPNFMISILNIGLMIMLIIGVLKMLGASTDSVVTLASVISLGVSLALQDVISGVANGFLLVTTKPFVEGEYVKIDSVEGTVVSISMFNTVLKTVDGIMITIPNSSATKTSIINYNRLPVRRIVINVPVAYGTKTEVMKKLIGGVAHSHEKVLKNPEPSVRLTEYQDSNLNYTLKCWSKGTDYWDTMYDLMEQILDVLVDNNIPIDYNQLDLHIKDLPLIKTKEVE